MHAPASEVLPQRTPVRGEPRSKLGSKWECFACGAKFYDLHRDTREEWPVSTEIGAWGGQEFVRVIRRHMMRKQKYPDEGPATGRPYDGIENLRPETVAAVEAFLAKQAAPLK